MPNEMNPQEIAERLEKEANYTEAVYHQFGADFAGAEYIGIIRQAAADERRIANGELVEVTHGHWIPVKKECYDITDEDEYPQWKYCSNCKISQKHTATFKHCPSCGALMDGSRGRNNDDDERKDEAE